MKVINYKQWNTNPLLETAMGMFDELRAINITHEKFDRAHNGLRFQTKDAAADEINTTRMKHSTTKGEAHD